MLLLTLATPLRAQCPGSGDCCVANGTPGCVDQACCDAVCAADPFCCGTQWDGVCADQAATSCPQLCGAACCLPDGGCVMVAAETCIANGGTVVGSCQACSASECLFDEDCDDGLSETIDVCRVGVCVFIPADFVILSPTDATDGPAADLGLSVCQVVAQFADPAAARLLSVVAVDLTTSDPGGFFQHPAGQDTAPPQEMVDLFPDLIYDSFVTIGPAVVPMDGMDGSAVSPSYSVSPGSVSGGWFNADPLNGQGDPDANAEVLIAQLTTSGFPVSGTVIVQVQGDFGAAVFDCSADLNGDGMVNAADELALLQAWGVCPGCPEDLNGDGVVDDQDLAILLSRWGSCVQPSFPAGPVQLTFQCPDKALCNADQDCDDGDPCTTDVCDPQSGCVHTPSVPCCGNGIVEPGETCDPPDGSTCDASCQFLQTWCCLEDDCISLPANTCAVIGGLVVGDCSACPMAEESCGVSPDLLLPGDWQQDWDHDLEDYLEGAGCFGDSNVPSPPECHIMDHDRDLDVDIVDFVHFQTDYCGPVVLQPPVAELQPQCPLHGQTIVDPRPQFQWLAVADPQAVYRLDLWKVPGIPTPPETLLQQPPYLVIEGIQESQVEYPATATPLLPGESYVWQISVTDPQDPQVILIEGESNALHLGNAKAAEEFAELVAALEIIRQQINEGIIDLQDNTLFKEVQTIRALGEILLNLDTLDDTTLDALQSFVECNNQPLAELVDTLDAALGLLEGLTRLIKEAADDLKGWQIAVLNNVADQIATVRAGLDESEDIAADLATIKNITGQEGWDPFEYLQQMLIDEVNGFEEKLKDVAETAAKKILAKLAGSKAAGPIFSIIMDLINFIDLTLDLNEIDDLELLWDLTMRELTCKANELDPYRIDPQAEVVDGWFKLFDCSEWAGGTVELIPRMFCWEPAANGDPNDGTWIETTVLFEDTLMSSRILNVAEMTAIGNDTCQYNYDLLPTVEGAGPCYIVIEQVVSDGIASTLNVTQFLGVVKPGVSAPGNSGHWGRTLDIQVISNGAGQRLVEPGEPLSYSVVGALNDADTLGLAGFSCNVCFSGGPLAPADPASAGLAAFDQPLGYTNPGGFGGVSQGNCVIRAGGAQNTIGNPGDSVPFPAGAVVGDVALQPDALLGGSLVAPLLPGTYELGVNSMTASALAAPQADGSWKTVPVLPGVVSALDIVVCDPAVDLGGGIGVDAADLAVLLGAWGNNPGHSADLNGDDIVNAADLALLLGKWNQCL